MILFSLLIISLLTASIFRFSAFELFSDVAKKSHNFCIINLPEKSFAIAELKALVCAESFSNLSDSQLYISSGLIHLFVVSGAHLILIESALMQLSKYFKINSVFIFSVLCLYGLACGLNAPVVRCLIAFALSSYLQSKNIFWPAHFKLLIIGALTLCFNYQWVSSLGLQMSWIAAFIVMLTGHFFKNTSLLLKQGLFYLALLPSVVFFQVPSPTVILFNILLAPILEFILFPLGILVWFFNFLHPVFDFLIYIFKLLIEKLEIDFQIQNQTLPSTLVFYNWLFIFGLHALFHIIYINQKRSEST
ncbi:MAG: ComEC/Rec2 family competence protein [Pseudobdellovibrio sp.]